MNRTRVTFCNTLKFNWTKIHMLNDFTPRDVFLRTLVCYHTPHSSSVRDTRRRHSKSLCHHSCNLIAPHTVRGCRISSCPSHIGCCCCCTHRPILPTPQRQDSGAVAIETRSQLEYLKNYA